MTRTRGFPFLTPFPQFVWEEFARRKRDYGLSYPSDKLTTELRGPQTVWLRATSNVITKIDNTTHEGLTLYTGNTFNEQYGFGSKRGVLVGIDSSNRKVYAFDDKRHTPGPGLESFNVSYTGTYGTIKQGVLNWKCYSKAQFSILEEFFMVPGATMLVEYGWSNIDSTTLFSLKDVGTVYDKKAGKEGSGILGAWTNRDIIEKRVERAKGQYDAAIGWITNFGWSLTSEGVFDCSTTITTQGRTYLALRNQTTSAKTPTESSSGPLTFQDFFNNHIDRIRLDSSKSEDVLKYIPRTKNLVRPEEEEPGSPKREVEYPEQHDFLFVSWKYLEWLINEFYRDVYKATDGSEINVFEIDSSDIMISAHPKLISTNGDVLIIPNPKAPMFKDGVPGGIDGYQDLSIGPHKFPSTLSGETEPYSGKLYSLFINVNAIKESLKKEPLAGALQDLLYKISDAGCSMWHFQIRSNPDHENKMEVVDIGYTKTPVSKFVNTPATDNLKEIGGVVGNKPVAYLFRPLEANSIVREFTVDSDLTSEITSTVVYSRASKNKEKVKGSKTDVFGTVYEKIGDRVLNSLLEGGHDTIATSPDDTSKIEIDPYHFWYVLDERGVRKRYVYPYRAVVNSHLYKDTNPLNNRNNNLLVPIKASITLNGIGGIRVGDIFMVSELPKRYFDMGVFQVMDIQDDISKTNWTTRIEGQFRVMNTDKRGV